MKRAILALALGAIALFGVSGPTSADNIDDYLQDSPGLYPWNPELAPRRLNCRVVEVPTMSRLGTAVIIQRRVCD
jgi:hypothetical protein